MKARKAKTAPKKNKLNVGQKLLIDLIKLRDYDSLKVDGFEPSLLENGALKSIRELATFQFTCRKCEDAPCVEVCPANALERNMNGLVERSVNLCVRCKSCISVCPFGTIMNDLFETKTSGYDFFDLSEDDDLQKFVKALPKEVVSIVEQDENPEQHIYRLTEHLLIKDYAWFQ